MVVFSREVRYGALCGARALAIYMYRVLSRDPSEIEVLETADSTAERRDVSAGLTPPRCAPGMRSVVIVLVQKAFVLV